MNHPRKSKPPRPHGDNTSKLPLDLENLPSMSELLGESDSLSGMSVHDSGCSLPLEKGTHSGSKRDRQRESAPAHKKTKSGPCANVVTHSILKLDEMPGMEQLLQSGKAVASTNDTVQGIVSHFESNGFVIDLGVDDYGIIPWTNDAGPPPFREGDVVEVQRKPVHTDTETPVLRLNRIVSRRAERQKRRANAPRVGKGDKLIVDGSNVCRSYAQSGGTSSIAHLLTLLIELVRHSYHWHCYFDANEGHVLAQNRAEAGGERAYERLVSECSRRFTSVECGTNADDTILAAANRNNGFVISNDRYCKPEDGHFREYPWLAYGSRRLFKWHIDRGRLVVPALNIDVVLRHDIHAITDEILSSV